MATVYDNMCAWAKKIADSKAYHYKSWSSTDAKTRECPICHNLTGKYKGWNCIGFAFASWRHGGGLKSRCDCGVIGNQTWEKILKAKTDAEANKIAQDRIGLKDVKVIRNGGKAIPESKLQKGDIISYFNGSSYYHTLLYIGGGKIAECTSGKTPNVGYGRKLATSKVKVAIRYTGGEKEKPKMKKVLDISNYQGVVAESTFKSMKKNGMDMVVIRCSYTHRNNPFSMDKDKSFEKNIVNAYKAGMKIGVYHYSQAISTKEAITEAEYVLSIIKRHKSKITLPVVFDCEFGIRFNAKRAKGIGKTGMLDICNFFCKTVEKAGFKSMVYANLNTLKNYISAQLPEQRRMWVAQYPYAYKEVNDVPVSKLDYKKPYYMWQFTSSGRVQGVGGHVDLSYLKGDEPKPHTPTTYKGTFPTLPKRGWLQKGDKGVQVKNLQKLLVWLGYSVGSAGVDGEYGKATASAVLQFEKDYKLKYKDGEWGKECNDKARTVKR